jgi:predicted  nucleic acid-binding Zn-ribbon protein
VEEAKTVAEAKRRDEAEDAKVNKKLQKLTAALEEQAVRARSNALCSPAISFAQEKTAKAEEEAALLEEQSQHYKDELDKAHKQIEKLKTNSQPVGHTSLHRAFITLITLAGCLDHTFTSAV